MDLDPIRLDFVPTPRLRRLAMVAGLAVAMAVVTSHGELLVVAVVPLVLLVGVPRSDVPAAAAVSVSMSTARCVEGDEVELVLTVRADGCDQVQAEPVAPPCVVRELEVGGLAADVRYSALLRIAPGRICRRRSHPHSPVNARAATVAKTMLGDLQRGQPVCGSRDAIRTAFW